MSQYTCCFLLRTLMVLLLLLLLQDADILWQWSCSNGSSECGQGIWHGWHGSSSHFYVQAAVEPGGSGFVWVAAAAGSVMAVVGSSNSSSSSMTVCCCARPTINAGSSVEVSGRVNSRAGCSSLFHVSH
jgi:hypothetical protein